MQNDEVELRISDNSDEGFLYPNIQAEFHTNDTIYLLRGDYIDVESADYSDDCQYTYRMRSGHFFKISDDLFVNQIVKKEIAREYWDYMVDNGFERV